MLRKAGIANEKTVVPDGFVRAYEMPDFDELRGVCRARSHEATRTQQFRPSRERATPAN